MKLYLWILISLFVLTFLRVKIRKYFWKDRQGNKLKFKEFMKRWRSGVEGINGLQQKKMQLMGIWITLTGVIAGIVVNVLIRIENMWWWMEIILFGSLILILVQFLGTYQAYKRFKLIDIQMKEIEKKKMELEQ
jgi:hypothetical protein